MPYKSLAQARFLHAVHPDIAARWDKETNWGKKLPKRVKKKRVIEGTGMGAALMFKWILESGASLGTLLEVSPIKAGKIAGEAMYKYANNYAKDRSLRNMVNLTKKSSQVDRIRDIFAKRKMKGRDLGVAFDEHKKLAMDRMKFKNHKASKPSAGPRLKNAWNKLDRQEKFLLGLVGVSMVANTTAGGIRYSAAKNRRNRIKDLKKKDGGLKKK